MNEASGKSRPRGARATRDSRASTISVRRGTADHSRLGGALLFSFMQRMDASRRRMWFGDIDLASIMSTIALAAIEAPMRDPAFREKYRSLDTVIGVAGQRGVNATSVAAATGIPRQTVRRKIKRLLSLGVIVEVGASTYVIKPGFLQRPGMDEAWERVFQYMTQLFNDCLRNGVFELDPSVSTKAQRRS